MRMHAPPTAISADSPLRFLVIALTGPQWFHLMPTLGPLLKPPAVKKSAVAQCACSQAGAQTSHARAVPRATSRPAVVGSVGGPVASPVPSTQMSTWSPARSAPGAVIVPVRSEPSGATHRAATET